MRISRGEKKEPNGIFLKRPWAERANAQSHGATRMTRLVVLNGFSTGILRKVRGVKKDVPGGGVSRNWLKPVLRGTPGQCLSRDRGRQARNCCSEGRRKNIRKFGGKEGERERDRKHSLKK